MSPSELARFEALFERNYHDVARFCARRSATPEDGEDAATEVFGTAWRRIADVPPAPQDRLWLFGVARRTLANANRANVRRTRLALRLQANAPPPAPPPDAGAEARVLVQALAALSASDRELLLLTGWEELTPAQIAVVVGSSAAAVSRRLHRARRRLAAQLDPPRPELSLELT
jgi:RNA polymerase sigma-70 factor (ECF subfamily)